MAVKGGRTQRLCAKTFFGLPLCVRDFSDFLGPGFLGRGLLQADFGIDGAEIGEGNQRCEVLCESVKPGE